MKTETLKRRLKALEKAHSADTMPRVLIQRVGDVPRDDDGVAVEPGEHDVILQITKDEARL